MSDTLYIVIPCYNEEEALPGTKEVVLKKLVALIEENKISDKSRILFVNDGSKDKTWEIIKKFHAEDKRLSGLCLSHNKGHQNALLAGLETAAKSADMVISMDADLQDDVNVVDQMIAKYYEGADIVYGVRSSRKKDSFFKRVTAERFYKTINHMGGELIYNHADYRLMSKRAINALSSYHEVNLFLRGIVPMLGFKSDIVYYARGVREKGESKYPLKKMLSFAYEGITSMTLAPIRLVRNGGIFLSLASLLAFIVCLTLYFLGFSHMSLFSILTFVLFIGGLLMISIGLIGDYVGKTYLETKARPRYIVWEYLNEE